MAKNTSILLGDYFNRFISSQVETGKFSSASDVVRTALRLLENQETKKQDLINALKEGEDSGFVENFNEEEFIANLNKKYLANEL